MASCFQLVFSGQVGCSEEAPAPSALLAAASTRSAHISAGQYFTAEEGLTRQAWGSPHHVDFSCLAFLTLTLLGVISNDSHNLPPK